MDLQLEKKDRLTIFTLNRPRSFNALTENLMRELAEALQGFEKDSESRVAILTGAGRAFCFGADFSDLAENADAAEKVGELLPLFQGIVRSVAESEKPFIAALNGFATGAGLDLALACDLRVASDRAKFGEAFVKVGMVPDGGGTYFLPRLIGSGIAAEMCLTGEPVDAERALTLGLVNRVVEHEELLESTCQWAGEIAAQSPTSLKLIKRNLRLNAGSTLDEALDREARAQELCVQTSEFAKAAEQAANRLNRKRGKKR